LKEGSVAPNSEPIPFREFLDFELEIGLLLHRDSTEKFGYFLANDLTDRGLQVQTYNRRNPAPGFTIAKSFPGSLRVGPLLALGDASLWPRLTATLRLNDEERQTLRAADCHVNPAELHRELFHEHEGDPWLLAVTGTPSGTLFRTPRIREKLITLLASWRSLSQAGRIWLSGLRFLVPGDHLVLHSPILGRSETRVV
jgi:2-keto-4-pentenoate hydratase/2-oxohepta-3-ene-1,7-dioic acid hydratase in catechol pathway